MDIRELAQRISRLSPQQREILEKKLLQDNIDITQLPITPADKKGKAFYPLSYSQERLWYVYSLDPGNFNYNLFRVTRLEGQLNIEVLHRSANVIIQPAS